LNGKIEKKNKFNKKKTIKRMRTILEKNNIPYTEIEG